MGCLKMKKSKKLKTKRFWFEIKGEVNYVVVISSINRKEAIKIFEDYFDIDWLWLDNSKIEVYQKISRTTCT